MPCEIRFRPLYAGPLDRVSRACPAHGPVDAPAAEGVLICCGFCKVSWTRTTAATAAATVDFGVVSGTELSQRPAEDSIANLAKRVVAADATTAAVAAAANNTADCIECLRLDARLAAVYLGEWATWDSVEAEEIVEEWVRHVEDAHGASDERAGGE